MRSEQEVRDMLAKIRMTKEYRNCVPRYDVAASFLLWMLDETNRDPLEELLFCDPCYEG
jgi:hypothetical protein